MSQPAEDRDDIALLRDVTGAAWVPASLGFRHGDGSGDAADGRAAGRAAGRVDDRADQAFR
jgi:hypothetical protein